MGYYSEVGIVLYEKDYKELIERARAQVEYFGTGRCILDEPVKHFQHEGNEYAFLYWNHVRWYEEFEEVLLVHEIMGEKDHSFVRIGENIDDIHWNVQGEDFYDFLGVQSRIYVDPIVTGELDHMYMPEKLIEPKAPVEPKKMVYITTFGIDYENEMISNVFDSMEKADKYLTDIGFVKQGENDTVVMYRPENGFEVRIEKYISYDYACIYIREVQ